MSQNSDPYRLSASSPTSSNQNTRRLPSHQQLLSSSSTIQNDSSSSSSQSHTSPIVNDVCAGSQNGVRNASTTMKISHIASPNGNHSNDQYAFTLEFAPPVAKTKKTFSRNSKPQLFPFNMTANDPEDLHSPFELDVPLCENPSLNKVQNDFLIDRMLKDGSKTNGSAHQSSYTTASSHASPLLTPSSEHRDVDALSDAGTYIIEGDMDIAPDDEPEPEAEQATQDNQTEETKTPSSFKRYAKTERTRQGTFDIHALATSSPSTTTNTTTTSNSTQAVHRPIVDSNVPTRDRPSSSSSSSSSANLSSSSSLHSLPTESDNSSRKEPEGASHHLLDDSKSSAGLIYARQRPNSLSQQRSTTPPQNQLKTSECFVISPTFESKPFSTSSNSGGRRKADSQWKPRTTATSTIIPTKDTDFEMPTRKSPTSPPLSTRSNQSETERFSFRLQQQPRQPESKPSSALAQRSSLHPSEHTPTSKSAIRPHTAVTDQSYASSFQRNSSIRQTMPASTQHNRPMSSSTTSKYLDDNDEISSSNQSLTKVYMNKSFALRRQRTNPAPATAKSVQMQQPTPQPQQPQALAKTSSIRQPLKATTSIPASSLSASASGGQTNRAVELRRARAQAKIEELAQRTRRQLKKTEQHNDIMSASWHSNASSSSKKDFPNPRSTNTTSFASQKQDLSKTRTLPAPAQHRSSSASPNPLGEVPGKTSRYRKTMTSSMTDESQYERMNGSTYSEGERCDSLRDDGQRLAIKLIQLSSGILAKLKPNSAVNESDANVRELEQLVNQLQTVNRTLSTIDASLTGLTSDEPFL